MASSKIVARVLNVLADSRPGSRLPDGERLDRMVEAYALVLEPVSDGLLMRAAVLAARQPGDFMPSAGTLYDLALGIADDAPDPGEAWAQAWRLVRRGERPALDVDLSVPDPEPEAHPRVRAALRAMGGPGALQEVDKAGIHRAQFEKVYAALGQGWRRDGALGQQRQSAERGLEAPRRPGLPGDVQQRDSGGR